MTSPLAKWISDARLRGFTAVAGVLGSALLIPFSAMAAWVVFGADVAMKMDERFVENGDKLHGLATVVYEYKDGDRAFGYGKLSRLDRKDDNSYSGRPDARVSYLMSEKTDELKNGYTKVSYRVIEDRGDEQVVEVDWADDDYSSWSRYRATESRVEPIRSRMFGFGTFFVGMWYVGLPFALSIFLIGLLMKFCLGRIPVVEPGRGDSEDATRRKDA